MSSLLKLSVWSRGKRKYFQGLTRPQMFCCQHPPLLLWLYLLLLSPPAHVTTASPENPQAGSSEDIDQPWNLLLPGTYLANTLTSLQSLFTSHPHNEAYSEYLIWHRDVTPEHLELPRFQSPHLRSFFLSMALMAFQHPLQLIDWCWCCFSLLH